MSLIVVVFFFFNDTATTEIYTLSLHDALPDLQVNIINTSSNPLPKYATPASAGVDLYANNEEPIDRKSTRLNSSH